ncbi:MAG TPA: TMEM165/GDT1 family protein [Polyangiaceae bacterium]|nr:TMEM165/GDT1 family protein [Polyangiaceae bacterium]
MHGWTLFLTVFGLIFVAELPDKTALAALVLATRHRAVPVLIGAGLALAVQSLVAVTAGQLFSLLPHRPVQVAASLLFLVSAVVMWRRKEETEDDIADGRASAGFWSTTGLVFTIVFIAEWGDLTQLATAAMAAEYRAPVIVFTSSTLALWAVAAIAVFVGNRAGKLLDPHLTQRVAAVLFGLVGAALLVHALQA